ncbi:MAG: glycosyltransferase [Alphaproteobacteria bacterium]|nr:glycosyltransferase [Alphaproteobacteria bacterium]
MPDACPDLRFSIVTPSLNQARFLDACLDSVTAQGWPDVEHWVIDGGSTDGTREILERRRGQLAGFVCEPDGGAADAINKGLARVTGDVVAWLNADDFLLPGALARVAQAFRAHPDASFVFGNGMRAAEDGALTEPFFPAPPRFDRRALAEGLNYVLQPATFINGAALRRVGPLDAGLRWGFDWDLWLRLSALAEPVAIDATLAASREYEATLTASGGFPRAEELRRIAERHSGKPMTRGALCYFLDTLFKETGRPQGGLDPRLAPPLVELWKAVQDFTTELGTDRAGLPTTTTPPPVTPPRRGWWRW